MFRAWRAEDDPPPEGMLLAGLWRFVTCGIGPRDFSRSTRGGRFDRDRGVWG